MSAVSADEVALQQKLRALRAAPPLHPAGSPEQRVIDLQLQLPPPPKPGGVYRQLVAVGDLLYVAGLGPSQADGSIICGKVSEEPKEGQISIQEGHQAGRALGLTLLSLLKDGTGDLDQVVRVVKVLGFVNCTECFKETYTVINGFSELMRDVFGEAGLGTRSAVGMASLPDNMSAEVEVVLQMRWKY
ncbi:hypothetical protein WJX72_010549 [[Myrmecia] bisecta]|uniref:Uncharacterized protein n=1 Tax=[Myrmecia] bisecta TaxID=41462 RepID=A0AAW1QG83_9CHLO